MKRDQHPMLRIENIELEVLKPWAMNPRKNDKTVDFLIRSIRQFGFNVPILCDSKYRVIAGHARLKAAHEIGMCRVPVIILPLAGRKKQAFALAENKVNEVSEWDDAKLRVVIEDILESDMNLKDLGFSDREVRNLSRGNSAEIEDPHVPIRKRQTAPGDLFLLGRHRLLCGDSQYKNDVDRLLDGNRIDHVFAGPPYFNQRPYCHWKTYESHLSDMKQIVLNCRDVLYKGGVIVWNIANGCSTHLIHVAHHAGILEKSGLRYVDMIIWLKSGANYGVPRQGHILQSRRYYPAPRWEALLVFQKDGDMPKMTEEAAGYMWEHHTDVWEVPQLTVNQERVFGHPAVCPVEIPYRTILAYTGSEGTVFDPFGGSGTTLVAAEKSGRTSFLLERKPEYCDAILARWEALTGGKAKRLKRI